ncbi:hypothetical protein XH98_08585 [Bradyrhizobium sp. CCBAU 51745]|nr:hypothetical protein [Bradyrhizobium sp. CCBAU 51745]
MKLQSMTISLEFLLTLGRVDRPPKVGHNSWIAMHHLECCKMAIMPFVKSEMRRFDHIPFL